MKKNKLWGLSVFAFLFFTISSCDKKLKEKKEKPKIVKAPNGIITLNEAKILCDNYDNRRIPKILEYEEALNSKVKFTPTQFINFNLETIKQYIKYLEQEAAKAKVKPDSLRIYFANYGIEGKNPNKNTVLVLPTANINGKHGGFFINANGKGELIRNHWRKVLDDNQKSKDSFAPSVNMNLHQEESLILNRGHGGSIPNGDF